MRGIKNIIFDLGGVIIDIDMSITYKVFSELLQREISDVYHKFDDDGVWAAYDKGDYTEKEFFELLRKEAAAELSDQQIRDAWNALLLDMPKERIDLILDLSNRYDVYLLSNTSFTHIQEVSARLSRMSGIDDLKKLFKKAYYSFEIDMRKPSKEIYEYVLKDSDLNPQETLFVDDTPANIEAAKETGIQVELVTPENNILRIFENA